MCVVCMCVVCVCAVWYAFHLFVGVCVCGCRGVCYVVAAVNVCVVCDLHSNTSAGMV